MKWLDNFHPSLRTERQKDQSGPLVPRILGPEGNLSAHSKAQTRELELRSRAPVFVRGLEKVRHHPYLWRGWVWALKRGKSPLMSSEALGLAQAGSLNGFNHVVLSPELGRLSLFSGSEQAESYLPLFTEQQWNISQVWVCAVPQGKFNRALFFLLGRNGKPVAKPTAAGKGMRTQANALYPMERKCGKGRRSCLKTRFALWWREAWQIWNWF